MTYLRTIATLALSLMVMAFIPGFAQGGHHGGHGGHHGGNHGGHHGGHVNPDSLTLVTVNGTAIVDSTMMHSMYYLDEDGDGAADYFLNFGPHWYEPDSGSATRPNDGDAITIYGGQYDPNFNTGNLPVIIVYEINGQFWRDPYAPFWNNMGNHAGHHHMGGHHHHAFGWMHDSLVTVSLNGVAMVDTTFMFSQYYLDEDQDNIPDYFLNFGPPWYEPSSGATRPNDGDTIDIVGGLLDLDSLDMVIVYEINGLTWFDSTLSGHHFGGGWVYRYMNQSRYMHTPWDSLSGMRIFPGWHNGGGHHGGMMPDSLFGQMLQLYPQNMPNVGNQNAFAGFEVGMFGPNGQNFMMGGGMMGGHLNFNNQVQMQLHYNDIQLQGFNIDESTIEAKIWNPTNSSWQTVANATVNTTDNTVSFATSDVTGFIILTGQTNPLTIEDRETLITKGFALEQNYPNPFNPTTNITFQLNHPAKVVLTIYNVLGQQVTELINEKKEAGTHVVQFNGADLTSGIYFYELKVDGNSQVLKMNLMK